MGHRNRLAPLQCQASWPTGQLIHSGIVRNVGGDEELERQLGVRLSDLQQAAAELPASSDDEEELREAKPLASGRGDALDGAEAPTSAQSRDSIASLAQQDPASTGELPGWEIDD